MKKITKIVNSLLNKDCARIRKMHRAQQLRSLQCAAAILEMYGNKKPYTKKELRAKGRPLKFNLLHGPTQTLVKKLVAPYIKPTKKLTPK